MGLLKTVMKAILVYVIIGVIVSTIYALLAIHNGIGADFGNWLIRIFAWPFVLFKSAMSYIQ